MTTTPPPRIRIESPPPPPFRVRVVPGSRSNAGINSPPPCTPFNRVSYVVIATPEAAPDDKVSEAESDDDELVQFTSHVERRLF